MHSPDPTRTAWSTAALDLRVAAINLRIDGPGDVLGLLNQTLSNVPRFDASASPDMTLTVSGNGEAWKITGADGRNHLLAGQRALPQIGGAVVSRAVSDVATSCDFRTMRAAVIERDGWALAMIGDDWESALTLATHLHGRGWRFIGSDHALYDAGTRQVHCVQKSLYINAASVSHLPVRYRRAVEASPWYVTPRGIWFYAVDPRVAGMLHTWSSSATLAGVLMVDGSMLDAPLIEPMGARQRDDERLTRFGIDWNAVGVAELRMGGYVETCDLIEHWFESVPR